MNTWGRSGRAESKVLNQCSESLSIVTGQTEAHQSLESLHTEDPNSAVSKANICQPGTLKKPFYWGRLPLPIRIVDAFWSAETGISDTKIETACIGSYPVFGKICTIHGNRIQKFGCKSFNGPDRLTLDSGRDCIELVFIVGTTHRSPFLESYH